VHDPAELEALMNLLEDPDREVQESVVDRLIQLGETAVVSLEQRWESTLRTDIQEKIENVIKQIQQHVLAREMQAWRASGGKELLYGAYLVARFQYPDLEYEPLDRIVERIRKDIWLELNNRLTALEKVRVINYFLYDIYKFDKSLRKSHAPQLYLVNHVLDTKKGSPVVLGLIYAELARRLELPIYGVNLPRNFVLCYYDPDYPDDPSGILFYINPYDNGTVLGKKELSYFLKQQHIEERDIYFNPCSNVDIIERLVLNLQFAFDRSGHPDKADMLKNLLSGDQTL